MVFKLYIYLQFEKYFEHWHEIKAKSNVDKLSTKFNNNKDEISKGS